MSDQFYVCRIKDSQQKADSGNKLFTNDGLITDWLLRANFLRQTQM